MVLFRVWRQSQRPIAAAALQVAHRDPWSKLARNGRAAPFSAIASKYPSQSESAVMSDSSTIDRNASHLVCGKCSTPIVRTQDLVFFKWRGPGIHVSSITEAPLERLRAYPHPKDEENFRTKHKLRCLACDHPIGAIATVYSSDKILFKAKDVAIQMPENQSPMISLSGYPSSMLGFSMWTELLLMLESQPDLKAKLQIQRIDNIQDFSEEKKELNSQILLSGDLKSLLRLTEDNLADMNHVNLLTAFHRAAVLTLAARKDTTSKRFRFRLKTEAPEDELLECALIDPAVERAAEKRLNAKLWNLVDAVERLMTFSLSSIQNSGSLMSLAMSLWRLNIGRSSLLRPLAIKATRIMGADLSALTAHEASTIASAIAHLSTKDIRRESWIREVLHAAADVILADQAAFEDPTVFVDTVLPLLRSFSLTGNFHDDFFRQVFSMINAGILDKDRVAVPRGRINEWKSRLFQIHLENEFCQRGSDQVLSEANLKKFQGVFAAHEKQAKSSSFGIVHIVAKALESMELKPVSMYTFKNGYVVDLALPGHQIAIEINNNSAYTARDLRNSSSALQHPDSFKALPFSDFKARHLEREGWIVVQIPGDDFALLLDQDKRIEYLSMLIEMATYSREQDTDGGPQE